MFSYQINAKMFVGCHSELSYEPFKLFCSLWSSDLRCLLIFILLIFIWYSLSPENSILFCISSPLPYCLKKHKDYGFHSVGVLHQNFSLWKWNVSELLSLKVEFSLGGAEESFNESILTMVFHWSNSKVIKCFGFLCSLGS